VVRLNPIIRSGQKIIDIEFFQQHDVWQTPIGSWFVARFPKGVSQQARNFNVFCQTRWLDEFSSTAVRQRDHLGT
jgi:hypothetical protein